MMTAVPQTMDVNRSHSGSPRVPTSTLTSALRELRDSPPVPLENDLTPDGAQTPRKPSFSIGGQQEGTGLTSSSGAVPISMKGNSRGPPRRESVAGSMMAGISWGGISVGSFIRDDVVMQGTSPYTGAFDLKSPSFHSSSYLPRLEAAFMRDFKCCDQNLPTLHDLLQHYEDNHASGRQSGPAALEAAQAKAQQTTQAKNTPQNSSNLSYDQLRSPLNTSKPPPSFANDLEVLGEDMDMDDMMGDSLGGFTTPSLSGFDTDTFSPPSNPLTPKQPALNLNTSTSTFPNFPGIRNQTQPSTPLSAIRPGSTVQNPSVSALNSPSLSHNPLLRMHTPDSSIPGTPGELDPEFLNTISKMSVENAQNYLANNQYFSSAFPSQQSTGTIDDPAKSLYSPGGLMSANPNPNHTMVGGFVTASNKPTPLNALRLATAQYGADSPIAQRIREQQRKVGLADTVEGLNGEEPKPFRCPVIGCEKAYKNQNGLKYHKTHGHNNQTLHENPDGTFSIVDPNTLSPYPGTMGMEKEKPYKCEICGKRYKNLNGLKYHKLHSPPCNTEGLVDSRTPASQLAGIAGVSVSASALPGPGQPQRAPMDANANVAGM